MSKNRPARDHTHTKSTAGSADVQYHAHMTSVVRSVYATVVDLAPLSTQAKFEPFSHVKRAWNEWSARALTRRAAFLQKAAAPQAIRFNPEAVGQQDPIDGISIIQDWWESKGDGSPLSFAQFQLRESQDDGRLWTTNITLAARGEKATLAVQMGIESAKFRVQPLGWMVRAPGIWGALTPNVACSVGSERIAYGEVVTHVAGNVGPLVKRLCDHNRNLPVVVVSARNSTNAAPMVPTLPQAVSRELFGLAHVHFLADAEAAWELSRAIKNEHGCYNGAIRIYWPGFDPHQLPDFRTLLVPEYIAASPPNREASTVATAVLRKIAPVSALRFATPHSFAEIAGLRRKEQRADEFAKSKAEHSDEAIQYIEQELKAREEAHAKEIRDLEQKLETAHAYYTKPRSSEAETEPTDIDTHAPILIEYFKATSGKRPVLDFADDEFPKDKALSDRYTESLMKFASRWLEETGNYFSKVAGGNIVTRSGRHEDVWEYRAIKSQGQWVRVLFALINGRRAVLLHAVSKRQNQLDRGDIDTAKERLRAYLS